MLFGKKEKKAELPDLPPLPNLPSKDKGSAPMPAFPDSPEKRRDSEGMHAMIQPPGRGDAFIHGPQSDDPKKVRVVEMEEWHPQNPQFGEPGPKMREHPELHETRRGGYQMDMPDVPSMPELPEEEEDDAPPELEHLPEPRRLYVQKKPVHKLAIQPQQQADVFVRIDKFHTARKSLKEIQNRLDDIDELIRRIRDTKLKEEQELASWEKDLMQVKSRMQTVTENIFEKVE
ncbi:MAG: hypothetical protein ABH864_06995 [archaeon]